MSENHRRLSSRGRATPGTYKVLCNILQHSTVSFIAIFLTKHVILKEPVEQRKMFLFRWCSSSSVFRQEGQWTLAWVSGLYKQVLGSKVCTRDLTLKHDGEENSPEFQCPYVMSFLQTTVWLQVIHLEVLPSRSWPRKVVDISRSHSILTNIKKTKRGIKLDQSLYFHNL